MSCTCRCRLAASPRADAACCSLVIMDEAAEVPLGIGRSWPHPAVGDGEAVAMDALLRNLGVTSGSGQRLALSLPLDKFAATGGADVGAISGDAAHLLVCHVPARTHAA